MSREVARPVCLITGGARRIGAAFARRLAPAFDLALHYNSSRDEAEAVAIELRQHGGRVELFPAEFSEPEKAAELVRSVSATFGPLDLVINSASAFDYDDAADFTAATMQRLLAVNVVAPLVIAREFARYGSPRALLVNMLDNKVMAPNPDYFSYSVGKFALKAAADMLAMRFAGNMRVNSIAPGNTLVSGAQSPENFEHSWRRTLTGSGPTLDDLASTVEFLWNTPSINGETIVVDGGQRLMGLTRDVAFIDDR